jgi:hypothetical protein
VAALTASGPVPSLDLWLLLRILEEAGTPLATQLRLSRAVHEAVLLTNRHCPDHATTSKPATDLKNYGSTIGQDVSDARPGRALVLTVNVDVPTQMRLGKKRLAWLSRALPKAEGAAQQQLASTHDRGSNESGKGREVRLVLTSTSTQAPGGPDVQVHFATYLDVIAWTSALQGLLIVPQLTVTSLQIWCSNMLEVADYTALARWHGLQSLVLLNNRTIDTLDCGSLARLPGLRSITIRSWMHLSRVQRLPPSLTKLEITCNYQLRSLDLSPVPGLISLHCMGNKLTGIEGLSACTQLTFLNCTYNNMTSLRLCGLPQLREARVYQLECETGTALKLALRPGACLGTLAVSCPAGMGLHPAVRRLSRLGTLRMDDCQSGELGWSGAAKLGIHTLEMFGVGDDARSTCWWAPGPKELPDLKALTLDRWADSS